MDENKNILIEIKIGDTMYNVIDCDLKQADEVIIVKGVLDDEDKTPVILKITRKELD